MFRRASIGFLIAAVLALSACVHNPATSAPPTQPATAEQRVYADLFTAQTALEGIKAQSAQFPQVSVKTQINQAIAAYNAAEQAFSTFETAKGQNLSDPTTIVQIRAMIADLENQIVKLGQAFSTSSQPAPMQGVK
jgi:hypothetical protein